MTGRGRGATTGPRTHARGAPEPSEAHLDVLLVDDESTVLASVSDALRADGHAVSLAHDGDMALVALQNAAFDLLICDMRLPRTDGMGIFRHVRAQAPSTDFVFITAFGAVPEAVAALKEGATDYLTKPFRLEELRARVAQIDRSRKLRAELALVRRSLAGRAAGNQLVGRSPALRRTLERIETFAHSDYPVLVTGESGTGKELVVRMIHASSARKDGPLVAVNCAAFPETLIEAELFGYRRGAFTGAFQDREGRFRAAHKGTLFLDEVAEMPLSAQAKLLRVLQEGAFEPLGQNARVEVDVRVLSATHRDLKARVAAGQFREDLYYRLKVLAIDVPPLRERRGDLPFLVEHFLQGACAGGPHKTLSAGAMAAIAAYPFPGNVRELEHAIQHGAVLARGGVVEVTDLPADIADGALRPEAGRGAQGAADGAGQRGGLQPLAQASASFEREYLLRALACAQGRRSEAAGLLGISRKTLWEKLRRHGLLDVARDGQGRAQSRKTPLDTSASAH